MRETSVRQLGALTLVFCLLAGAAEAKRIYYQVDGRTYWYELSEEAARNREAALAAARALQDRVTQDGAGRAVEGEPLQPSPAAQPRPDEVTGAVPRQDAKAERSRKGGRAQAKRAEPKAQQSPQPPRQAARTERPSSRPPARSRHAVPVAQPGRAPAAPEPQPSATANLQAPPSPAAPQSDTRPAQAATPQPETTGSVEAPVPWPELPVPPGPSVVETVTYDFKNGLKRTVLRDGTAYQEAFDPKAFYRFGAAPGAGTLSSPEPPVLDGQADQK